MFLTVRFPRFRGPLVSGNPKIGEDAPVCKVMGGHCRTNIGGDPAAPNFMEQLGEDNAELAHQRAVDPGSVLRARTNLVARPFPCAGLGVDARVYRDGGVGICAGKLRSPRSARRSPITTQDRLGPVGAEG